MTRTPLALLLALAAAAAHAQGLSGPPPDGRPPGMIPSRPTEARPPGAPPAPAARAQPATPLPRGAVLEEIAGTVRDVDRNAQKFAIDSGGEPVTLSLDRNTMVYTAAGLGTVLDVVPGAQIRAGRNADFLAYWVQVRPPAGKDEASPTPGQGTGPAGSSGAPAVETGAPGTPAPGRAGPSPVTPGAGTAVP